MAGEDKKPSMYPVKRLVGLRPDQDALLSKARAATGRSKSDILREGGIALSRRLVADKKREKDD